MNHVAAISRMVFVPPPPCPLTDERWRLFAEWQRATDDGLRVQLAREIGRLDFERGRPTAMFPYKKGVA